jgi:protein subunit release factor A
LFSVTAKDCELQTFRAGGKGGQNQNTRDTGVRWRHRASGAVGESREHRTQWQNKKAAWLRMATTPLFRIWLARERWVRMGLPDPEKEAEREMHPANIRVEYRINGRWVEQVRETVSSGAM